MPRLTLAALLAALAAGCADRPKLVPAAGKVVHKGQPVTAGAIALHPAAGLKYSGDGPSSVLQVDGSFALKTYPHGDGAPPGTYKATLSQDLAGRLKRPEYADPTRTPWTVEIPESGLADKVLEVR